MQRNIFMIMLFVLIILPIVMLFANDNVFFIIIALIMLVFSVKNLHNHILSQGAPEDDPENAGVFDDLSEDMPEIDMERFSFVAKIARNLIIILFYIYCMFQLGSIVAKAFIVAIILYWIYITVNGTDSSSSEPAEYKETANPGSPPDAGLAQNRSAIRDAAGNLSQSSNNIPEQRQSEPNVSTSINTNAAQSLSKRLNQAQELNLSVQSIFYIMINLSTIVLIIFTACNKFIRKVI